MNPIARALELAKQLSQMELAQGARDTLRGLLTQLKDKLAGRFGSPQERQAAGSDQPSAPYSPQQFQAMTGLWRMAKGDIRAFVQYLATFPNGAFNNVLQNREVLTQVIKDLNEQVSIPAGEESLGIPAAPLQSSNIKGFTFDDRNNALIIQFQNGSIYGYGGVPKAVFEQFRQGAARAKTTGRNQWGQWWTGKQPSLGAAMWEFIRRGGFPYQKLN